MAAEAQHDEESRCGARGPVPDPELSHGQIEFSDGYALWIVSIFPGERGSRRISRWATPQRVRHGVPLR